MSETAGGAPLVNMNGSFQTHEEDESTSAYDHRPISDHDDMRHYNTYEAYPSFLPLAPPFQQGSWEPRAPASPCPVITGTFLSNDPLHERSQMIHDNVANGEWYTNGYSDSVAARPHGSTEDQPQGYGPHQWSYSEPTVITGPNVAYRANATHIQTPSYLSDAGQASRSQFPANLSLDATQEPWSAVAAHPGGYNMLSSNLQSGDEISHYPENTISSTSSFINGTGAITPDSSWPNNVVDQAGSCNFGPSVLSIRMKDVEHETHGLQEQGASQFQYNVQEGSPSTNHNVHEHVAAPKDAWYAGGSQHLAIQLPSRSLSTASHSGSDQSARRSTGCLPDVLSCPDPTCDAIFRGHHRKGSFNRHRRLNHQPDGARIYLCGHPSCEHVFKRQDARLKHHRSRHPELGEQGPVPRSRQCETQDELLRDVSGWTGPMSDENHYY